MTQGTGAQSKRGRDATWSTKAGGVARNILNPFIRAGQMCNTNYSSNAMWSIGWPILQVPFVFQETCQIVNQHLKDIILVLDTLNWKGILVLGFNKCNKNKDLHATFIFLEVLKCFPCDIGQNSSPKVGEATEIHSRNKFYKDPRKSGPIFQVWLALTILSYLQIPLGISDFFSFSLYSYSQLVKWLITETGWLPGGKGDKWNSS